MKIILATVHLEESTRAIPLAAACLKAGLKGHQVLLKNYYQDGVAREMAGDILKDKPELVGFTVYLWNRKTVLETIKILREQCPGLPIIAGGPEVTADPGAFLEESGINAVNAGEGEETILQLVNALDNDEPLPRIQGLYFEGHHPGGLAFCSDLKQLSSPILTGALDLSLNRGLLWELSRGCPFACDFCFESKGSRKVRYFPEVRIEQELQMIAAAGITQVFVLDPTFNVNKERVLRILRLIRDIHPGCYYYFEVRTEFLDEETAEAFSHIPCTLQIGLQSASDRVLNKINRQLDPEDFSRKLQLLSNAGVSFGLDLIYGLPGDTLEGFRSSLDYALRLEPNHLDIFTLAVLPGTVLHGNKEVLGLNCDDKDPYLIRETPGFSRKDMEKAGCLSRACDALYNNGRGISWFSRVCSDIKLNPAELLESWPGSGSEESPLLFLEELYIQKNREDLFPVMKDLFTYLDLLEDIETSEAAELPRETIQFQAQSLIKLHSSARLRKFSIHPQLVLDGFPASSEELLLSKGEQNYSCIFWNRDYEIQVDLLTDDDWVLLEKLQDGLHYEELSKHYDGEELSERLVSGLLEGYLEYQP